MAKRKSSRPARSSAIHSATSDDAFATARKNDLRRYPSPEIDGTRLYPLADPAVSPGFSIGRQDSVFAIGSCFARNIEGALHRAGMTVLSREPDLGPIGESVGKASTFLNKYTAHSILNELKWALERDSFPGDKIIYPVGDGLYCDPQLGLVRLPFPLADIMDMRARYLDAIAEVALADVVIVTLGYVEAWYDRELDLYLNIAPPPRICKAEPERFEFRVLGYDDILDALEGIYALLKAHREKPLKMLLTVSPVPLASTFRDMDVMLANTYSKSVQRAAAEAFVAGKPDVDYFPSYETVTLTNPDVCWARNDYRHISPDIVTRIMSNVLVSYIPDFEATGTYHGRPMTEDAVFATARMLAKLNEGPELAALFAQNRNILRSDEKLLARIADVLQHADLPEGEADVLGEMVSLAPLRPRLLQRLISAVVRIPDSADKARALLALHAERFPTRTDFRARVERSLDSLENQP
ncbi:GSCFA family protein [Roseovarius halotolerans]|uniref:GSCFA family protein n=1 Tax=Roseovarius halotolerans TaxID=505353 RepID=A0A1X6YZC7_9RHOB|nr:GSCFA domain-containing protein [Roseovarius halotolerans]RKT32526.1 GSCFA family protein [Roseovarius halotolerans]SLN36147.1 GSCFA family protein [Roseovarius halotolerans]